MIDPIKEFVRVHRAGFDDLRPSSDVFTKIEKETGLVKNASGRSRIYRLSSWAIAASVLIGLCIYFYDRPRENFAVDVLSKNTKTVPKLKEENIRRHEKRALVTSPVSVKPNGMAVRKSKKRAPYNVNLAGSSSTNEADVILSLLSNEVSSSTRISGLQKAGKLSNIEVGLIEAIVERATMDPNSNVRLAAVEVIVSRLDQPYMPEILEKIFLKQDDPFVQTQLIDVIANIDTDRFDPDIKNKLIALTENPATTEFVKYRAYAVLMKH
ncbi:MAG: hypothetical protein V4594_05730 [Bacteroidota bacterium]